MNNSTKTESLTANDIKYNILNAKGNYVKVRWKSDVKPAAKFKEHTLKKVSEGIVRAGVDFKNLTTVQEGIEKGERGEVGSLPWGEWYVDDTGFSWFPYVIIHKGKFYIRLYPSKNNKIKTQYFVDDKEVTKDEFKSYLTPGAANKIGEVPECFSVKEENILGIPEEVEVEDE